MDDQVDVEVLVNVLRQQLADAMFQIAVLQARIMKSVDSVQNVEG